MTVTREDYRLAILGDGAEEWVPLAGPMVRLAAYLPELTEPERAAYVSAIYEELLASSLIAIAGEPAEGRRAKPLAPVEARAAIAADGWRRQPGDIGVGFVTTRPGLAEWEATQTCWACDGYVSRIASGEVEFEGEEVGGTVPVCDDHARQEDWPEGAERWVTESLAAALEDAFGLPRERLN
jgi:hypothetical protein